MKDQRQDARHRVGLILALVGLIGAVTVVLSPTRPVSAQAVAPSWSYTGSLNSARDDRTATLLQNGKVLVAGGVGINFTCCVPLTFDRAELYDPDTGTWSITGNLKTGRTSHTATLLLNGQVLVAGGGFHQLAPNTSVTLNSAELYDPATGTWSYTGSLNVQRLFHTATLLPNGKVLVAGGEDDNPFPHGVNTAELYDPATGAWNSIGSLRLISVHSATLLPNGKVLLLGSSNLGGSGAELYDPVTGTQSFTDNPENGLGPAMLLPNGQVLVIGSGELYNPATETWTKTGNLNTARNWHTATLLRSGKVLVAGGFHCDFDEEIVGDCPILNSVELYDPATGTWSYTANLNTGRDLHTATLLLDGKVLVAGGSHNGTLNSAELYDPGTNPPSNQIDDARTFVRQHYLDFLNREPDAGGLIYWTERITGNSRNDPPPCPAGDAHCIHDRRIGVSAAFFIELEFQDTGYYVYRFYKASFGRQPNYTEFTSDRGKVVGGSNLEANKQAFADEWVQRAAFLAAYPITMSNTEVVNKLFDTAGLTASIYDSQRQQEISAMNGGRSRALVLRDVIEIPDFKNIPDPSDPRYAEIKLTSQYNPAFVLMQYFGYLHRDLDRDGYDFWLDVVNNRQPNNYRGMVCSFITSTEYQLRFGSAVTRSNADCGQ